MVSNFTCKWGTITSIRSSVLVATTRSPRRLRIVVTHTFNIRRNNFRKATEGCGRVRHQRGSTVIIVELQKHESPDQLLNATIDRFEHKLRVAIDKERSRQRYVGRDRRTGLLPASLR